ncbi:MAG: Holliday junction resolvase RecU [Candidatus Pacearchaeota archaeon]
MAKLKGMALEDKVNKVNLRYRKKNQALIVKKSTPLKVTRRGVTYQQSTVDYSGIYKSKQNVSMAIAFDAKETKNKTNFPISNIEDHQILFLELWDALGGDAFLLIHFTELNQVYKLPIAFLSNFIKTETRKSIPIDQFKKEWLVNLEDYLGLD